MVRIMAAPVIRHKEKVLYPELSYQIVGAAFRVFNTLGPGHRESFYHRGLANEFANCKIDFSSEYRYPLKYGRNKIGTYIPDFVVEGSIAVELKSRPKIAYVHMRQVMEYLRISGLQLGLVVDFTQDGVRYRRILSPKS